MRHLMNNKFSIDLMNKTRQPNLCFGFILNNYSDIKLRVILFISNLLTNDYNISKFFLQRYLKYVCMTGLIPFLTAIISYLHQCDDLRIDILSVNARTLKRINHLLKRTYSQTSNSNNIFLFQRTNNEINIGKY